MRLCGPFSNVWNREKTCVHLGKQNGPQWWGGHRTASILERDGEWIVIGELVGVGLLGEL